jgi:hypothetical protein
MSAPNIVNVANINAITTLVTSVGTTATTIVSAVTTNHVYKVGSLTVTNKTGSTQNITVYITRSGTNYYLTNTMAVPGYSTIVVIGKDAPINLTDAGPDSISALSSAANTFDIITSYDDIS